MWEITGDSKYRQAAERFITSFAHRLVNRIETDTHDLGFLYSLSCVNVWQLTGNAAARDIALHAAEMMMQRYNPTAGIIQAWGDLTDPEQQGRMIIDCNMNLPLLYWASEQTGNLVFADAALSHAMQAAKYIVRPDASTYHTYYIDVVTGEPRIVQSLTKRYLSTDEPECEGLLMHSVYHMPAGKGVDECCSWGDYFYLEALIRVRQCWTSYW